MMKTEVYDKAMWHIDSGMPLEKVINHFSFFLKWCVQRNLLSEEGEEIVSFGVDESISLHSRMFTDKGNAFMNKFYNKYISALSDETSDMDKDLTSL